MTTDPIILTEFDRRWMEAHGISWEIEESEEYQDFGYRVKASTWAWVSVMLVAEILGWWFLIYR